VRLTKGERDQLADVARDLGLSISTYMRQVVLSRPLPRRRAVRPIPEVNRETYHALGRLAADLNAMMRCMTEHRQEPRSREVLEALELVAHFVGSVRAEVLGTTLNPEGGDAGSRKSLVGAASRGQPATSSTSGVASIRTVNLRSSPATWQVGRAASSRGSSKSCVSNGPT